MTKLTGMKTYTLRTWYTLVLALRLNAAEDFQWTKINPSSFYYGTFPPGTFQLQLIVFCFLVFIMLQIDHCLHKNGTKNATKVFSLPFQEIAETKISALTEMHFLHLALEM